MQRNPWNPACLRELERQLFALQGDEPARRFVRRLGMSEATWSRLKSGERQIGSRLAWRAVEAFPHLRVLVPEPRVRIPRKGQIARAAFWSYVAETDHVSPLRPELGSCWEWTLDRYPNGYGRVAEWESTRNRVVYTHRRAWEMIRGRIPHGLWVLHHCDNPPCCRPSHLWLGTASDNAIDRERKGRGSVQNIEIARAFSLIGRQRISDKQVIEIVRRRSAGESASALAAEFEVSAGHIYNLCSGGGRKNIAALLNSGADSAA